MDKIILLTRKISPTAEIYIENPIKSLIKGRNIDFEVINTGTTTYTLDGRMTEYCRDAVIIISRSIPLKWLKWLQKNKDEFSSIVYLFDDDFSAGKKDKALPFHYRFKLGLIDKFEFKHYIELSNTIIVSSKYLQDRYSDYEPKLLNPVIHSPMSSLEHHENDELTLTYYASFVHDRDFMIIQEALTQILDEYNYIKVELIGGVKLKNKLPDLDNVQYRKNMRWEEFKNYLVNAKSHIFLVPREPSEFNKSKSYIKLFDVASLGAAGIYSSALPYSDIIEHEKSGLLIQNNTRAWIDAIKLLIENKHLRHSIALNTQNIVTSIGDPKIIEKFWTNLLI